MVLRTKFLPKSKVFFSALRRQNLFLLRKILSGEQRGIRFNVVDERQHLMFCFLISEPVRIGEMANALYMSRPYLSAKFKWIEKAYIRLLRADIRFLAVIFRASALNTDRYRTAEEPRSLPVCRSRRSFRRGRRLPGRDR